MNGFILLYQDIRKKLKRDPTYDIISDIIKALMEFNFFENIYTDHPHCD